MQDRTKPHDSEEFDVFISHTTEDKDFVFPLAHALRATGLRIWFDDFELQLHDTNLLVFRNPSLNNPTGESPGPTRWFQDHQFLVENPDSLIHRYHAVEDVAFTICLSGDARHD